MEKNKTNEKAHTGVGNQEKSLPKASTISPPQYKINKRSMPESSKTPPPPKNGK